MLKTKTCRAIGALTVCAAFLAAVPAASAGTLTYTATQPATGLDFLGGSLNLNQFNPSLGTLNSVTLTFSSTVTGTIGYENLSNATNEVTANLGLAAIFGSSNVGSYFFNNSVTLLPVTIEVSDILSAWDTHTDYGGTSGRTYANQSGLATSTVILNSTDWTTFIGTGNVGVNLDMIGNNTFTGAQSSNFSQLAQTSGAASISVAYDYTPVNTPEPASVTLTLAGIGALLLLRRKVGRGNFSSL